jgi:hypothetical protein
MFPPFKTPELRVGTAMNVIEWLIGARRSGSTATDSHWRED